MSEAAAFHPPRARLFGGLVLAGFAALAIALVVQAALRLLDPPPAAGEPAPSFTAVTAEGDRVSLSELGGRVVLLDFALVSCAGCIAATPKLNRLHARFDPLGLELLSLVQDPGDPAAVSRFISERRIQYAVATDAGEIAEAYGVVAFPTVVLLDRAGRIRAVHAGATSEEKLDRDIRALLAEPAPPEI